jgi:hypothetical protein
MTKIARNRLSAAAWGVTCVFSVLLLISAMAAAAHKASSATTDTYIAAPFSVPAE